MKRALTAVGLLLVLCSITIASQATIGAKSPIFGTWKLNVAKSKYSPGPTPRARLQKGQKVENVTVWDKQ